MVFDFINFLILPLLIFLARVSDVTIGTIRLIFVAKGFKLLSPILGFFEVLIYIITMTQILSDMTNAWLYIAYAAGFAAGNYVGICIEEKLSIGKVIIRIITQKDSKKLIQNLRDENYHLTIIDGRGRKGKVKLIFSVIKKKSLKKIIAIINETNPKAFYSIEDIRYAQDNNIIPQHNTLFQTSKFRFKKK